TYETKTLLVHREAIQKAGAARRYQILLTASAARMLRIPRASATALFVGMSELRDPRCPVARPVAAGVIRRVGVRPSVRLRSRQDVVCVWRVAHAVDDGALLGQRKLLAERVADAGHFERIAMQFGEVLRDP